MYCDDDEEDGDGEVSPDTLSEVSSSSSSLNDFWILISPYAAAAAVAVAGCALFRPWSSWSILDLFQYFSLKLCVVVGELSDDYTQEDSVIDLPFASSQHWEYIKIFLQFFQFKFFRWWW